MKGKHHFAIALGRYEKGSFAGIIGSQEFREWLV